MTAPDNNYTQVKHVLLIILFANLIVAAIKIIFGTLIQSAALTADGLHSVSDSSGNIIGLIGIKLAAQPPDAEHPYGHDKLETIACMSIGLLLVAMAGKIIYNAFQKFSQPAVNLEVTTISLIALVATLIVNIFVAFYEHRQGVKLNSPILISDAAHTKSDILVSLSVLTALLLMKMDFPPVIDPIVSLVIAGFILKAAWSIFRESIHVLIDGAAVETEKIRQLTLSVSGVRGVHNIRSRGTGNRLHIDMHILLDPDMTLADSHDIQHRIEELLQAALHPQTQVLIHTEPLNHHEE